MCLSRTTLILHAMFIRFISYECLHIRLLYSYKTIWGKYHNTCSKRGSDIRTYILGKTSSDVEKRCTYTIFSRSSVGPNTVSAKKIPNVELVLIRFVGLPPETHRLLFYRSMSARSISTLYMHTIYKKKLRIAKQSKMLYKEVYA